MVLPSGDAGRPETPSILGCDGPYISASSKPIFKSIFFNAKARFEAKVDFPTPPLALEIAIVNFVPIIGFLLKVFGSVFAFVVSLKPTFLLSIFYHYLVFTNKDTI